METEPSFEHLVESRLGFGSYQKILLFLMSFSIITDGIEIAALSIILPILTKEWSITENLQGLMGSMLFVGILIGSLLSGLLTDKLGRKQSLTYFSFIQFILGISSALVYNVYSFIIIRGLFGVILGFIMPLIPALAVEWTPLEKRGKVLVIVTSVFSVGQLIAIFAAYLCLDNLATGNWRLMLFLCSFPSLLLWYGCFKYLLESPRYIMITQDIKSGMEILNYVMKFNKQNEELFSLEKDSHNFEIWRNFVNEEFKDQKRNFFIKKIHDIFNDKYWKITLGIWASWFGLNFAAYGLLFILPFFLNELDQESSVLQGKQHGLLTMMITTIGEASSGILAYFLIETKTFGRKNSLALSQFITGICSFFCYAITIRNTFIVICLLSIARFFGKMCFTFAYPLTAEIYPTALRTTGLGLASAFGRLSVCIMPFLLIKIFYINFYFPFLMIFLFSFIGLLGTWLIPFDTRGRLLDVRNIASEEKKSFIFVQMLEK